MSKARAKGTGWEVELLPILRCMFGDDVERRGTTLGSADDGDFSGVPWLHEAKKTDVPHFLQWAKTAQRKHPNEWAVLWSGDRRRGDGPYVLLPLALYERLVKDGSEDVSV